jgi:hypothetical protein
MQEDTGKRQEIIAQLVEARLEKMVPWHVQIRRQ